jgi:hypothetical protein
MDKTEPGSTGGSVNKSHANIKNDGSIQQGLNHGTEIVLSLVKPWWQIQGVVLADSYFALVGVVKQAHVKFPKDYLAQVKLGERGDHHGLAANNAEGIPYLLAFALMDRDRRYVIVS